MSRSHSLIFLATVTLLGLLLLAWPSQDEASTLSGPVKRAVVTETLTHTQTAEHTQTLGPYTYKQARLLNKVRGLGDTILDMPETVQAILLTESSAGEGGIVGDNGTSFGLMQVKMGTAAYVARDYTWLPQFSDSRAYVHLLLNEDYGLLFGVMAYKKCHDLFGKNWRRSVVCYNQGVGAAYRMTQDEVDNHPYLAKVRAHLFSVRKWRKEVDFV